MRATLKEVVGELIVRVHIRKKKSQENFSPMTCIGEIGENFLLVKISTYTAYKVATCLKEHAGRNVTLLLLL